MNTIPTPNAVQRDAEHLVKAAATLGRDAQHAVSEEFDHAKDTVHSMVKRGRTTVTENLQTLGHRVEAYPVTSLAIAAGVGVLLGALLRR